MQHDNQQGQDPGPHLALERPCPWPIGHHPRGPPWGLPGPPPDPRTGPAAGGPCLDPCPCRWGPAAAGGPCPRCGAPRGTAAPPAAASCSPWSTWQRQWSACRRLPCPCACSSTRKEDLHGGRSGPVLACRLWTDLTRLELAPLAMPGACSVSAFVSQSSSSSCSCAVYECSGPAVACQLSVTRLFAC